MALLESLVLADAVGRKSIPTLLLTLMALLFDPILWGAPKGWAEGCEEGLSVYGCIRFWVINPQLFTFEGSHQHEIDKILLFNVPLMKRTQISSNIP